MLCVRHEAEGLVVTDLFEGSSCSLAMADLPDEVKRLIEERDVDRGQRTEAVDRGQDAASR